MSDYCKHGTYVGGCGIDWMCGACEMGDPDPTIREMQARLASEVRELLDMTFRLMGMMASIGPWMQDHLVQPRVTKIRRTTLEIEEIRKWAISDTDDNWLARRHEAQIEEDSRIENERKVYTEIDEIHEYGFVPS